MTFKTMRFPRRSAAATASLVALAFAAAPPAALSASTTAEHSILQETSTVTVQSIDHANRHVTVVGPSGDTFTMRVPPEVHNFDQVKVGDKVKATHTVETEIVITRGNTPLPSDSQVTLIARAAKGELPAGAVGHYTVVTGAVLGIDMANHSLKIVSPQGGQVHTIYVRKGDRQKAMAALKVGDKITAYVTESTLLSVQPV